MGRLIAKLHHCGALLSSASDGHRYVLAGRRLGNETRQLTCVISHEDARPFQPSPVFAEPTLHSKSARSGWSSLAAQRPARHVFEEQGADVLARVHRQAVRYCGGAVSEAGNRPGNARATTSSLRSAGASTQAAALIRTDATTQAPHCEEGIFDHWDRSDPRRVLRQISKADGGRSWERRAAGDILGRGNRTADRASSSSSVPKHLNAHGER